MCDYSLAIFPSTISGLIMKKLNTLLIVLLCFNSYAQIIEKTYYFDNHKVIQKSGYQIIDFKNTLLTGNTGEPVLPYHSVSLLLPPGKVAESIEFIGEDEITIAGYYSLYPQQYVRPMSEESSGGFVKNDFIYSLNDSYPFTHTGTLITNYMNGYSIALCSFTPLKYVPSTGKVSFYKKVTLKIRTKNEAGGSNPLSNLNSNTETKSRIKKFVQNPEAISDYPEKLVDNDDYQFLIISPVQFVDKFSELIDLYLVRGIKTKIISTDSIYTSTSGQDSQEKIRNFIIQEYQNKNIQYVLLGGDVEHIPYRGFYCHVQSSIVYEDYDIPSDLYYSALDGNWNTNGNNMWGEIGEDDLLPEISVARIPASNLTDLNNMMNKIKSYQNTPVLNELNKPLLAGEDLWSNPQTWGGDYLDLLIGFHDDNGYTTIGIPPGDNIEKLYDRDLGYWSGSTLISKINEGKSFVHHAGHSNYNYVMRLNDGDITNQNFSQVNGLIHNYTLVNTTGCNCGGFDESDCIAEKMVNIENFAVAFIGNSRYGWFNEGQTEGPSTHLQREFVDALYNDKLHRIGVALLTSKIESASWVTAPGQWEEGALRWCFYCNNVLGDPAVGIWTSNPINVQANYQTSIQPGTSSISVNVTSENTAMKGLTCVILKDSILYGVSNTDTLGNCNITLDPPITEVGTAELIISGYNCLPTSFPLNITSVQDEENNLVPLETKLFNNYPNPFNPATTIEFSVSSAGNISLAVFNLMGQKVKSLINNFYNPGSYNITWNAVDDLGMQVPSGIYFYKLTTGSFVQTNKMILLR